MVASPHEEFQDASGHTVNMSDSAIETIQRAIISATGFIDSIAPHSNRSSFVYKAALCFAALNQILQAKLHNLTSASWEQYFTDGDSAFIALNPDHAQQHCDFFPFSRNGLCMNIPDSLIALWTPIIPGIAPLVLDEPVTTSPIIEETAAGAADVAEVIRLTYRYWGAFGVSLGGELACFIPTTTAEGGLLVCSIDG